MLDDRLAPKAEQKSRGIPPKPLNKEQIEALTQLLIKSEGQDTGLLLDLIQNCVPAGVDPAAKNKSDTT